MQSSHLLVVLIFIIIFGSKVLGDYYRSRSRGREKAEDEEAVLMMAKIDELEERIRVLEQIVTDPKESLSRQINNL